MGFRCSKGDLGQIKKKVSAGASRAGTLSSVLGRLGVQSKLNTSQLWVQLTALFSSSFTYSLSNYKNSL